MSSNGMVDAWMWACLEPDPTDNEKQLFDLFAAEYLFDGDYVAAASRCGFQDGFAAEYGLKLYRKSYVQRKLAQLRMVQPAPVDVKAEAEYRKRKNIAILDSIASDKFQKASARVAAVREIANHYGFHAPTKLEVDTKHRGGVYMVPETANIDAWEAAAAATQDALAEASKV